MSTHEEKLIAQADEAAEWRKFARSLAFEAANGIIDGHTLAADLDDGGWFDLDTVDAETAEDVHQCVAYLTHRGLIDRHPDHPQWVSVRDESEGTC